MERIEIIEKLTLIFKEIFKQNDLRLKEEMTANDVDGWDSLTHMLLISEVENAFGSKFKLKDLNKMKNVGDMIKIIETRLAE
jgi:acyl carrier protein